MHKVWSLFDKVSYSFNTFECLYIHIYQIGQFKNRIIYSYTINVDLMLISIELSKMWFFIVNIP